MVRLTGASLAWHRRRVGLTQVALAHALQVSPVDVRAWERGRAPLAQPIAEAILRAIFAARLAQVAYERTRLGRWAVAPPAYI